MLAELDIIKNTFEVKYAPAEWKKEFAGWDLNYEIDRAKAAVLKQKPATIKNFHHILRTFFKSMRDYHVDVFFFSTESAYLPFRLQGANGRYFLAWIDYHNAPAEWNIGDEVTQFNGMTIEAAIEDLKSRELGNPESSTDQAMAEIYLTTRVGAVGHQVPSGPITIAVKDSSGKEKNMTWNGSIILKISLQALTKPPACRLKPMYNPKLLQKNHLSTTSRSFIGR